jgi:5-methylcytosine-specific restriction enzyme B
MATYFLNCSDNLVNFNLCLEYNAAGFPASGYKTGDSVYLIVKENGIWKLGAKGVLKEETKNKPWPDADNYKSAFNIDWILCEKINITKGLQEIYPNFGLAIQGKKDLDTFLDKGPQIKDYLNDCFSSKSSIPADIKADRNDKKGDALILFDSSILKKAYQALVKAELRIEYDFLKRFVASLATKPFVILTGNSGTGKTQLAQLFAHWLTGKEGYEVVPVGSDWTDNRNIVGFVNHLRLDKADNPIYQGTAVLDLLLRAKANESRPFFLILDEMNLSHVERYFADFLSAMESHESVPLHQESVVLKTPDGNTVGRTVDFPDNLFVVGTVNVDETTYMFSPKVLDRANVLEFRVTEEDAKIFLERGGLGIRSVEIAPKGYAEGFLDLCRKAHVTPQPELKLAKASKENGSPPNTAFNNCRTTLEEVFGVMRKSRQEFAYRSMAEILRYVHVDFELTNDAEQWQWKECMDAQILQKILPKLHGSKKRIEPLLTGLAKYCEKGDKEEAKQFSRDDKTLTKCDQPMFKNSYEKLWEMREAVRRDQFVSYIQ